MRSENKKIKIIASAVAAQQRCYTTYSRYLAIKREIVWCPAPTRTPNTGARRECCCVFTDLPRTSPPSSRPSRPRMLRGETSEGNARRSSVCRRSVPPSDAGGSCGRFFGFCPGAVSEIHPSVAGKSLEPVKLSFSRSQRRDCSTGYNTSILTQVVYK